MGISKQKQLTNSEIAKIIIEEVNNYYGIDCKIDTRKRNICVPRQIAFYLIKQNTKLSLETIGSFFSSKKSVSGNKDHASVIHGVNTITDLIEFDKDLKLQVNELEDIINSIIKEKDNKSLLITKINTILATETETKLEKIMNDYKFKKLLYYKNPEVDTQEKTITLNVDYLDCTLYAFLNVDTEEITVEYIDNNNESISETESQIDEIFLYLKEYYEENSQSNAFTIDDQLNATNLIFS